MPNKKVLVTGLSGLIGGLLLEGSTDKYELSGLNRRPVEGVPCLQADIRDAAAIRPVFEGQDVVVHLSAIARAGIAWEEALETNLIGTYNVFEAARTAGVKRVIFASSGAAVTNWEREEPSKALVEGRYEEAPSSWPMGTHETPTRPAQFYGWSKVAGESLARHYSDAYSMSMICLRLGRVSQENRPDSARVRSVWCSHRDIVQLIEKSIDAPDSVMYDIFYGLSNNKWAYRDISHAREVLGYAPQDSADQTSDG